MKALIWDLDGTLIHFKINFIKARRTAMEILKKNEIPKEELSIKKSILDNVKHAIKIFEENGLDPQKINEIVEEIDREVSNIEYDAALKASRIDGIERVLEFARDQKLEQAIYTYNTTKNAITSLKTVDLLEYFSVIAGRDSVENPKPHKDHLLYICNKLDVSPEQIIVIGDTYRDIEGALKLGAKSVAIKTKTSGFSNKEIFEQADVIIAQEAIPGELIVALNQLL
ncbi:MAG: Phosphoglycolate phosphatase [Promethearchaeota archaeon]|jgi:HAD superfamily hydrolase (TIGR01549 family)|nr:MAG: Phosphoglycolate phosphatase [Candidatus Lokiarchaeota archaeon]